MRFAFDGVDDLRKVADLTDEEVAGADFGTYTKADPTLVELLVTRSLDTMIWLRGQGARFVPIYGRQAGKVGGRWKFLPGGRAARGEGSLLRDDFVQAYGRELPAVV